MHEPDPLLAGVLGAAHAMLPVPCKSPRSAEGKTDGAEFHKEVMIMKREKNLKPDKAADKFELSLEDMERVSGGVKYAPPKQKQCGRCGRWLTFLNYSEYDEHVRNCKGR